MLQSAQREYKDYKGLIVYQKALENTIALFKYYKIHKPLWMERFVIEQLLRSSASIGANIVEGYGRNNKGDYGRFLTIAKGSALEVVYWLDLLMLICPQDTNVLEKNRSIDEEIVKMLTKMISNYRHKS